MKLLRGQMPAAEFAGLAWVNSPPLSLASLRGRVVLLHFWDFSSVHCLRVLAYLKVWHGRYADRGLSILGIHAPDFDFGRDPGHVRRAVDELGIPFPVAMDNAFATWDAFSNRFWPASYLVDRDGFLVDYHFGEGGYVELEEAIQGLLRERKPRLILPKVIEPLRPEDAPGARVSAVSPEVYLGFRRGRIGNDSGFGAGPSDLYFPPPLDRRGRDVFYLDGAFQACADCVTHAGADPARVWLSYESAEVFVVAAPDPVNAPADAPASFDVLQDGAPLPPAIAHEAVSGPRSTVVVDAPRLYPVVRNPRCGRHVLELATTSPGLRFYSISFVGCVG
jgi:hypothetical protein